MLKHEYISTEKDRRAHQAMQNTIRSNSYKERREQLENIKAHFSASFISMCGMNQRCEHVEKAIELGWKVIDSGRTIEEAMRLAGARLQELAQ